MSIFSGVGTAAIQLAKFFGAKVATTAGSNEKIAYCQKLGADKAVNYKHGSWYEIIIWFWDCILNYLGPMKWKNLLKD